jgi:hypothetical protein
LPNISRFQNRTAHVTYRIAVPRKLQ